MEDITWGNGILAFSMVAKLHLYYSHNWIRMFRFPCGRWLGKGIDDGSIERLLVAEQLKQRESEDIQACHTPPRTRSPSARRLYENPSMFGRGNRIFHCVGVGRVLY